MKNLSYVYWAAVYLPILVFIIAVIVSFYNFRCFVLSSYDSSIYWLILIVFAILNLLLFIKRSRFKKSHLALVAIATNAILAVSTAYLYQNCI